ncbi:sugar ABC transporter ATP-binding protein [Bradyrhizobium sp. CCGB12]|uniref:sugar ABC transporter ATP-binding protein n=1 Tax=Bradyrhizobium sp. CCGB12 TaxID=2949632 RepID=UPI0020B20C64|nr:sugar ABC transporter ATP-binding protein [Bradyrhizobium sp. CCGB12]MCP3387810.1 sugar ABC transporter ATP-binding protein [Bradyrhizobium sp. CCGB12]
MARPALTDVHDIAPPVAAVSGVSKRFGAVQALSDVSLEFRRGNVLALVGENGAGKSTLMRILEGEHRPDSGTVLAEGRPVTLVTPREAHAHGIRVIHQEPEIIPELTVGENIFIGDYRTRGMVLLDRRDLASRAAALLFEFGVEDVLSPDMPARQLGPAQRQLIEIMRALRPGVRLLAFDEPTSSLTEDEAGRLFTIIRRMASSGVSIVYISHRLREIINLADRVAVLRDGQLVDTVPTTDVDEERLVRMMVGRPVTELFRRRTAKHGAVRLKLEGVSTVHVNNVSLEVRAGEILGLGGLVGAGRTEVARAIIGVDELTGGRILVDDRPVRMREPRDAIAAGIGLVPEDRKQEALLLVRSVRENASLVVPDKVSRFGIFNRRRETAIATDLVQRLRIKTPSVEQAVGKLSGGNQQKVVFARWLAREPKVLILDEPTRGIDIGAKAEIYRLVESLADDGMAILLISSEMPELLGLADRIAVMGAGVITGTLPACIATEEAVLELAMRRGSADVSSFVNGTHA